ncbi:MAG TPA: ATP-binding cassette domain-containing protein [Brevibacterium senegalense]|uniref:ATP-binding cassette domain-containing protein n=1 Tax=Brevibacterium senegalense TaxID=1033736 RepID=A0A921MC61_9MICO|nr:ATP-binding cassette domain-containing protein [Brevibacterium senegalense]
MSDSSDAVGPSAAVRLTGVSKRYGAVVALDDVTLEIPRGEIFGVLGESGAGKSTLLELMGCLDHPTEGTVVVDGVDPAGLRGRALNRLRHRIGTVFQGFNLLSNKTVRGNIELPLEIQKRRDPEFVSSLLSFVGLEHKADRFPAQLSGGERQRVAIARALATRPAVLLCDEPTSALDTRTTADILRLLERARDEFGATIVIVTHELDVVKAICRRAAVFERGRLREVLDVTAGIDAFEGSYLEHARRTLQGDEAARDGRRDEAS